jgi:hypothetical protein
MTESIRSMARIVYRGGSDSDDNLTPRPGQDEQGQPGRAPGLSVFSNIDEAVEPGGKAQGIDLDQLGEPLRPFPDDPKLEGGVSGHLSIAPATSQGELDRSLLSEWAATRKSGRVHWLTTLLRNALVQPAIRRPR